MNNSSPVMISKGTVIGTVEEVTPIDQEDPVWKEPKTSLDLVVRRCPSHPSEEVDRQARRVLYYVLVKVAQLKKGSHFCNTCLQGTCVCFVRY